MFYECPSKNKCQNKDFGPQSFPSLSTAESVLELLLEQKLTTAKGYQLYIIKDLSKKSDNFRPSAFVTAESVVLAVLKLYDHPKHILHIICNMMIPK
jgi:hypothetical protein